MIIGIDFGTTYTKIAYFNGRKELELFAFPAAPNPNSKDFIPTCVCYNNDLDSFSIGDSARSEASNQEGMEFCEAFKMLLPIEDRNEWKVYGWKSARSPMQVTADYLNHLLIDSESSFEKINGKITKIVLSVPELWKKNGDDVSNTGTENLQEVVTNILKLPVDHLRSEPVCAASYFVYGYRKLEKTKKAFNLLICDIGGGTIDIALCSVEGEKISVVDHDGVGRQGFGKAGYYFDRECVIRMYKKVYPNRELDQESQEYLDLRREFEKVKIEKHDQIFKFFDRYGKDNRPEILEKNLYTIKRIYALTYADVLKAFEPIKASLEELMARFQGVLESKGQKIDRVAIVGGFGQFPLVQQTLLDCMNLDVNSPHFSQILTLNDRFYAIAKGSAIIANGIYDPVEYYPHTIGVIAKYLDVGVLKEKLFVIIEGGKYEIGENRIQYAEDKSGNKIVFTVEGRSLIKIPVIIRLHGVGEEIGIDLPPARLPGDGKYYIGVKIDQSGLGRLVFSPIGKRGDIIYRMGDVNLNIYV